MADEYDKAIIDIKNELIRYVHSSMENDHFNGVSVHETGEIIDMIKDLSEVEKNCYMTKHYKHAAHNEHHLRETRHAMMDHMKYHDSDEPHDAHETMPQRELSTMDQVLERVKSMWSSSDTVTKKQMKADLTKLVGDMTV